MNSNNKLFSQDDAFWATYLKGRPAVPPSFFTRIFNYHASKSAPFTTAHDLGAGIAPYAPHLRSRFSHVIISDIVPSNIASARKRLGESTSSGYTFRVAPLTSASDITPGSVDLIFATNVMHFAEPQDEAMAVIARQLRSGGTFAAALFGPATLRDDKLQDIWRRISQQGGRELLKVADDVQATIRVMARTQGGYNVAPLDTELFLPGALRVHINMGKGEGGGGILGMLPEEEAHRDVEGRYEGVEDVEVWVEDEEEDWSFEADLEGVKEHFGSFPFVSGFPGKFDGLFEELERRVKELGGKVGGYFPVKVILATRR